MVDFKMTKEGLILVIGDYDSFEETMSELSDRLTQMGGFFTKGDEIALLIENHSKHVQDIPRIISRIREFGLNVSRILVGKAEDAKISDGMKVVEKGETKSGTKVVKRNVRSGQVIVHSGDVVIVGNLHRGAEVIAGGSVVVFGKAEGVIRAGLNEGYKAVVMAVDLRPTLIQISDRIAHEKGEKEIPSIAHVRAGRIVIDKWNEVDFEEVVKA
jgi:septum site-determining protein MinC